MCLLLRFEVEGIRRSCADLSQLYSKCSGHDGYECSTPLDKFRLACELDGGSYNAGMIRKKSFAHRGLPRLSLAASLPTPRILPSDSGGWLEH